MRKYLQALEMDVAPAFCAVEVARTLNSMCDKYWFCCPRIATPGVGKVILRVDSQKAQSVERLLDVVIVPVTADAQTLFEGSRFDVERRALDVIHTAFMDVCREHSWETGPARFAWRKLTTSNYKLVERWKKPVWRKDRRQFAQAWWRYEDEITLGIELQGEIQREIVLTSFQAMGVLRDLLGSLRWHDDHTVQLWRTNRRDYWSCNLRTNAVEFIYGPAHRGDPKGEYDLGRMYLEGFIVQKDPAAAQHWISLAASHGFERARKHLQNLNNGASGSDGAEKARE